MTSYTLPSLDTVAGEVKITLYSNDATLTVPTSQTVTSIGDLEETADVDIGVTQLSSLRLSLKEDYTNYTEGFWYKVLAGECWLRFYLVEGGSDTFYFFGLPQEETIEWTEHFLGSTYLRTAELELISMAAKLMDTDTINFAIEVLANDIDSGKRVLAEPTSYISAGGLFAAMLSGSGLNPSYDVNDVSFVFNSDDFRYTQGGNNYTFNDLKIATKIWTSGAPNFEFQTAYFDVASNADSLSARYAKLRDLIPNLLANFGLVMRMSYDPTADNNNGRHKIQLIQRGRAYADAARLTFGDREKMSTISKSSDLIGDATRASHLLDSASFVWFSKQYLDGKSTSTVPNHVDFDQDYQSIFRTNAYLISNANNNYRQLYLVSGTTWTIITGIQYWNYFDDQYETAVSPYIEEAIAGYIYYRFTNQFTKIVRTYGKLKANNGSTDSHVNASILQRTSINDGTGAANYYANKVTKSIESNELEIEWIKE